MRTLNHMHQVTDGRYSEEQLEDTLWLKCIIQVDLMQAHQPQVLEDHTPFFSVVVGLIPQDMQRLCRTHQTPSKYKSKEDPTSTSAAPTTRPLGFTLKDCNPMVVQESLSGAVVTDPTSGL